MGRPKAASVDPVLQQQATEAQNRATEEAKRINDANIAQQQQLQNINKNMSADLKNENRTVVEAGGTAAEAATLDNPDQKRKRAATGLASTLGIS